MFRSLRLAAPDQFAYLKCSQCYTIDDVDDNADFGDVRAAMKTIGMGAKEQEAIFTMIAAILHIGNIKFIEDQGEAVSFANDELVEFIASLLSVDAAGLAKSLTHRHIVSGGEHMDVTNNEVQAKVARDALAKALYSRLFDWLVQRINSAIIVEDTDNSPLSIGVLDIYGFEIFSKNGFEQVCCLSLLHSCLLQLFYQFCLFFFQFAINFVNEKLQQIFIQLTLQQEQEEYVHEGIEWKPIEYFNNKVVCELIEGNLPGAAVKPPGILAILDDVCATLHSAKQGADRALMGKLSGIHSSHPHFQEGGRGFTVKHYAGDVYVISVCFSVL
jgi:myosin-1